MKNKKNVLRIVLSALILAALCAFGECDQPTSINCGIGTSPTGCVVAPSPPEGGVIIE